MTIASRELSNAAVQEREFRQQQQQADFESSWDVAPSSFGAKGCCVGTVAQLVMVACLGSFQFGFNLSALNTSKSYIILDMGWCDGDPEGKGITCTMGNVYGSLVSTGVFIGAAVGCLLGGSITDYGRRMSMVTMHGILVLGCILSAAAEGFYSLLLARIVVGVGVGLVTVVCPMYISEMTSAASRGFFGVFHQLFITFGIFMGTLLGLAFGDQPPDLVGYKVTTFQSAWWRVMIGLPALISILALLLYVFVYQHETPHYMLEKRQRNKAVALLREIYGTEDVQTVVTEITTAVNEMKVLKSESLSFWSAIRDPVYRPVILIACTLSVLQQMTGINCLVANSNKIYSALKLSNEVVTGITVGLTGINFLLTFAPIWFADKLGRRTLMLIGTAGQTASLLVAMIGNLVDYQSTAVRWISVAATYGYIFSFAIAYGPILWVYLHEIFPAEVKQSAASVASALNWVATIVIVLPSDFLLTDDARVVFSIFACSSLFVFLFVMFFMKETKGLSIDDSPYFRGKARRIPKSHSIGSEQKWGSAFDKMEAGENTKSSPPHVANSKDQEVNNISGM